MMPEFWEYLITACDGSAIRFVADQDRDSTEKQLEGDPRLLTYRAKPQTQSPIRHRPGVRVLSRLRRLQTHKSEVNRMHDSVVTINNTNWPAHRKKNGTLVDLRVLDPTDRSPKPRLVFCPEKLRELGIPAALIDAAAKSDPQGLILFEGLPDEVQRANGKDDHATTRKSAN
jgi:hypothetical protein